MTNSNKRQEVQLPVLDSLVLSYVHYVWQSKTLAGNAESTAANGENIALLIKNSLLAGDIEQAIQTLDKTAPDILQVSQQKAVMHAVMRCCEQFF